MLVSAGWKGEPLSYMNCELPEVIKAKTSYKGECSGMWGGAGFGEGFSLSHADV